MIYSCMYMHHMLSQKSLLHLLQFTDLGEAGLIRAGAVSPVVLESSKCKENVIDLPHNVVGNLVWDHQLE